MGTMTPQAARDYWRALVENAARLIVDADTLFPSPRADSLTILAYEELGKAIWVADLFHKSWAGGGLEPVDISHLESHSYDHRQKMMQALHMVEGAGEFVSLRLGAGGVDVVVEAGDDAVRAQRYMDYLRTAASGDNLAKKRGFYVDPLPDGSLSVPHEIDRPNLATEIEIGAHVVAALLADDHILLGTHGADPSISDDVAQPIMKLLGPILRRN